MLMMVPKKGSDPATPHLIPSRHAAKTRQPYTIKGALGLDSRASKGPLRRASLLE